MTNVDQLMQSLNEAAGISEGLIGTAVGGLAGASVGGPVGAIAGANLGHDLTKDDKKEESVLAESPEVMGAGLSAHLRRKIWGPSMRPKNPNVPKRKKHKESVVGGFQARVEGRLANAVVGAGIGAAAGIANHYVGKGVSNLIQKTKFKNSKYAQRLQKNTFGSPLRQGVGGAALGAAVGGSFKESFQARVESRLQEDLAGMIYKAQPALIKGAKAVGRGIGHTMKFAKDHPTLTRAAGGAAIGGAVYAAKRSLKKSKARKSGGPKSNFRGSDGLEDK